MLTIMNLILSLKPKLCKNCNFFMPEQLGGKYDVGDYFGKCRKFGFLPVNSSEIEYVYSYKARFNENQCGKSAKFFESAGRDKFLYSE